MEAIASSSSSSSFRTGTDRNGPERTEEEEDQQTYDLDALQAIRHRLPVGWQPAGWCRRYRTEEALMVALDALLELPAPDALDMIRDYGVAACEGALLRTLAHMAGGAVRKPRGWYIATLRRGHAWTPAQVEAYVRREWQKVIVRMERSENPQQLRVAAELRERAGWAPGNVVSLARVRGT